MRENHIKYRILAEVREEHDNLLNQDVIYNDYVSKKSMIEMAEGISSLGSALSNCPPNNVPRLASKPQVRIPALQEWYPKVDSTQADACASQSPTYPVREIPKSNMRLQ